MIADGAQVDKRERAEGTAAPGSIDCPDRIIMLTCQIDHVEALTAARLLPAFIR